MNGTEINMKNKKVTILKPKTVIFLALRSFTAEKDDLSLAEKIEQRLKAYLKDHHVEMDLDMDGNLCFNAK